MYTSFHESDNNHDSILIANMVDEAVLLQNFELDMAVQFMKNGCFVTLFLGNMHKSIFAGAMFRPSWSICWFLDKPNVIDTGISVLSIVDPDFQNKLVDNITKIVTLMVAFCDCENCLQKEPGLPQSPCL